MIEPLGVSYPIDEILQKKPWTVPDAFRYCVRLARNHYENFPVGSLLIPKSLRPHVCALYAFARRADDIADEDFPEAERLPALKAWGELLEKCQRGRVNHPVFVALKETLREFNLPVQLLHDLLTAFKMDVVTQRHGSFEDLLHYCKHSANPVGRLVLHLFGYREESLMVLSDSICTSLQLANFWQDVSVDLDKGRIYLPQEDMARFSYTEAQLMARECTPAFRDLMRFQVDRSAQGFLQGAELVRYLTGRLRLEIKCTLLGGLGVLEKIRELNYDTLSRRPHFQGKDKARIFFQALFNFHRALRPKGVLSFNSETPTGEEKSAS